MPKFDLLRDACGACATKNGDDADLDFTFAFQPIVDITDNTIFSYEALVRGVNRQSAKWVLDQVNDGNRYRFDQACRVKAIALAARLGITSKININFLPNAVYRPETCIRTTFAAAERYGFPIERIAFEVVENDPLAESSRLIEIMREYKRFGFSTAIDDFGSGYRDLELLSEFQPDVLKLDIRLMRDIDARPAQQSIVRGVLAMCGELGVRPLAEGVETFAEFAWLREAGIDLYQGFYFARPAFEAAELPDLEALVAGATNG
jgi:EAL domain-containing protein (putative c-di-GMP-specific phosphodiesterase class I)